jgi:thiamine kinase-like enzyme
LTQSTETTTPTPAPLDDTSELRLALEQALSDYFGESRAVTKLERQPAANRSSFALEALALSLDNGTELELMFKNLSWHALLDDAPRTKPAFLYDPLRELKTYQEILSPAKLGAIYYGAASDQSTGRYWLFLENISGLELYQLEFAKWQEVAHWLSLMHTQFAQGVALSPLAQTAHLLIFDADFYMRWLCRALNFMQDTEDARPGLEWLAARYDQVVEHLLALPVTFIHGEFYASNVLVQETQDGLRVCPVDWEMAAIGPGLLDLAALIAGSWTEEEKKNLALSYYDALKPESGWESVESFLTALDYCRLHVAIQWLGWSSNWKPPLEQSQNWLAEALYLAEKLEL